MLPPNESRLSGAANARGRRWVRGPTTITVSPTAVSGGLSFATVSTGFHACGLTTNNAVYCWGYNDYSQLADGTRVHPRLAPVRVIQ